MLAKATFVLALGLWATQMSGKKRASFRHAVLAATFGFLLTLPEVSAIAPPVGIALRSADARTFSKPLAGQRYGEAALAEHSGDIRAQPESSQWPLPTLLLAAWITGTLGFLLMAALGLRQVLQFRKSGLPWHQGQAAAHGLAFPAGVCRQVDVLLHEKLAGPMTCGVTHPAIIFPIDAPNWDAEDLNRAIVHELEHVIRHDWAIFCVTRVVCAMYWFHPLVWTAWRRLNLEAERACDDSVLEHSEATAYADQLVAVARRISAAKSPVPAMANRTDLASRVRAVLDVGQRRGRAGALCVTMATAAAAALVLTVSPLRIVAAPQSASGTRMAQLRTDVKLVMAGVKVTYPNGTAVEGLGANDFELTDNGVPQAIRVCEFQMASGADPNSGYYILGYYPANIRADGQFRKINVVVKTASTAKVEFRAGYYINEPAGVAQSRVAPLPNERTTPSSYDKPPVLIFKLEPEYSEEARKAKYQGTVLLNVDIGDSGRVADVQVVRSLGLGLDEKAVESVKQWRFKPATKAGNPVSAPVQVEVSFRLL
jgi:TonB family protein